MEKLHRGGFLLAALVAVMVSSPDVASAQPSIAHARLECIAPGTYAVVLSGIDSDGEIQTAKVYFRSSLYLDFYYVEMERREDGDFMGILPQPTVETPGVVYYLEAVDATFNSTRSAAFEVPVEDPCDDQLQALFDEDDVRLVVGATAPGASPIPPGFAAAGIAGVITAAGVSGGLGGGLGVGAGVVVAAAGAAGATGIIVVADSASTTTTSAVSGGPPSPPGPPPTTTTPGPPSTTIPGPSTTTAPGPSTTTAPGPSTTTAPGPSTTTAPGPSTTTTAGPSTTTVPGSTTTTVIPTTTTTVITTTIPPPLDASCFQVTSPSGCTARVDATCIQPPPDQFDWVLDVQNRWGTVVITGGSDVEPHTWFGALACALQLTTRLDFTLTVRRGAEVDTATKSADIRGGLLQEEPAASRTVSLSLETHLAVPPADGSARARVLLDGRLLREIDSSQPVRIDARSSPGTRTVEAFVTREGRSPGTWRFAIGERGFVAGSLRVLAGTPLSVAPDAVVFRVAGEPNERVSFTFEIAP